MKSLEIFGLTLLSLSIIRPLLNLQADVDANYNDKEVKSDCKPILIPDVLVQSAQEHLRASVDKEI